MTTSYNVPAVVKGVNGFGKNPCDLKYTATLAVNTDTTVTAPTNITMGAAGQNQGILAVVTREDGTNVYMAINEVAAVPAGAAFALSTSQLLPPEQTAYVIDRGDVLHFISAVAAEVSVQFYQITH